MFKNGQQGGTCSCLPNMIWVGDLRPEASFCPTTCPAWPHQLLHHELPGSVTKFMFINECVQVEHYNIP